MLLISFLSLSLYLLLFFSFLSPFVLFSKSLCELPETHLQLAMNREAIDQMINVATSNIFDLWTVTSVAILLLVLSYTSDTHSYLLSYRTIENLMCVEYKDDQGLHLQTKGSPLLMK